jgi:uncharacterized membrane protein
VRFTTLFGLPAHPLLVHLPIVLLPLVGLAAIAMAFSSRVRDRIGWIVVVLAGIGFVATHLATESGEALEDSVRHTAALRDHISLADSMQPLALLLFGAVLLAMLVHWWGRREVPPDGRRTTLPGWVPSVVGVVVVALSIGANVQLVRVGHNGARATWHGVKVQREEGHGRSDGDGD